MAIRENVAAMTPQNVTRLRNSYVRMKGLLDDRGYDWLASLHGLTLPSWCEHGTALFLPWHRAYLFFWELAMQTRLGPRLSIRAPEASQFADVGLPWWDWTSAQSASIGLPVAFTQTVSGGNTLLDARIGAAGGPAYSTGVWSSGLVASVRADNPGLLKLGNPPATRRSPRPPADLPKAASVQNLVMSQTTFATFSTALEQVHNQVHTWTGGSMSTTRAAAYDPVFWSHHAMIDRLWYLWQIGPNGAAPANNLLDIVLTPFPMTVRQTLSISALNYDYAVGVIA